MKLLLLFAIAATACTSDEPAAINAVQMLGWSDIVIESSTVFSVVCGQDDGIEYRVRGIDAAKRPARAVVCCGGPGSFKGCTVRSP